PLGYEPNELPLLHPALQEVDERDPAVRPPAAEVGRARSGLASHAVARAVLSGAGAGHDPVRDGTGWNRRRSRPRAHPTPPATTAHRAVPFSVQAPARRCPLGHAGVHPRRTTKPERDPPSTMSTASLRSVTGRPRAASQPGGLPGVLPPSGVRRLILGRASHLDAVSGYPCRTWLPSNAGCPTTGTPAVRPARSSRTRASPPQPSDAHGG